MLFIDATILNAVNSNPNESSKILHTGLINVKDALLTEFVNDDYAMQLNDLIEASSANSEVDTKKNRVQQNQTDTDLEIK